MVNGCFARSSSLFVQGHLATHFFDSILPAESTVIVTGLGDGTVLWELLADRLHPIGEYRSDVTYPQFFKYLECLEISPCVGWMSSNETLRNVTSNHAKKLSAVAEDIVKTEEYGHFDMLYYDLDIRSSIKQWSWVVMILAISVILVSPKNRVLHVHRSWNRYSISRTKPNKSKF